MPLNGPRPMPLTQAEHDEIAANKFAERIGYRGAIPRSGLSMPMPPVQQPRMVPRMTDEERRLRDARNAASEQHKGRSMKQRHHLGKETGDKIAADLRGKADLFEAKNHEYGDTFLRHGPAAREMLNNIELRSEDDHGRFATLTMILSKINRYCHNFNEGGHEDSLDDIAVYCMMLKAQDRIARAGGASAIGKRKLTGEEDGA